MLNYIYVCVCVCVVRDPRVVYYTRVRENVKSSDQ